MIYDPEKRVKKNPATNPQGLACTYICSCRRRSWLGTASVSAIIAAATATAAVVYRLFKIILYDGINFYNQQDNQRSSEKTYNTNEMCLALFSGKKNKKLIRKKTQYSYFMCTQIYDSYKYRIQYYIIMIQ